MIKSGAGFSIVLRFVGKMNVYEHQSLSMGWKIDILRLTVIYFIE